MLLERQDLRLELEDLSQSAAYDSSAINALTEQLALLDRDISAQYGYALEIFMTDGRTMNELDAFVGHDLREELYAAVKELATY
jgi:hypothetical protein